MKRWGVAALLAACSAVAQQGVDGNPASLAEVERIKGEAQSPQAAPGR